MKPNESAPLSPQDRYVNQPDRKPRLIVFIAGLMLIVLLALGSAFLFNDDSRPDESEQVSRQRTGRQTEASPGSTATQPEQRPDQPNPLILSDDYNKVQQSFQDKLDDKGFSTQRPEKRFDYKLAPQLKDSQSLRLVPKAYAQTTCNLTDAPDKITAYVLKTHWTITDASEVAANFDIYADPASLPADGGTFEYLFSDSAEEGFVRLLESSGTYQYHQVQSGPGADIGPDAARETAQATLETYDLAEDTELTDESFDDATSQYQFRYNRPLDDFILVDEAAVRALDTDSVCNVEPSNEINYREVRLAVDGTVAKVINRTRTIITSATIKRLGLEDALDEYADDPPVPPIVLGDDATTGTVTIQEAVLVWYDYGNLYAQAAYIPMYLTAGTIDTATGGSARVFTLFPAASVDALDDAGILPKNPASLQLGTFNPIPPPPTSAGGTGKCWGNQVDYTVSCTQAGGAICNVFIAVLPDDDPNSICYDGCKSWDDTIDTVEGEDPCKLFLEHNDIPTENYPSTQGGSSPGGAVSCRLNGCPC